MRVRISELKLPLEHNQTELESAICRILRIPHVQALSVGEELKDSVSESLSAKDRASGPGYEVVRRSVDARKKPDLFYVYTIDVHLPHAQSFVKKLKNRHVTAVEPAEYSFPICDRQNTKPEGQRNASLPPVVVGSGPAGLFCSLMLARAGMKPIVLERGESVEKRTESVRCFWETGSLNSSSNVQFGEGGAGTFSDGKLNTLIKDPDGRIRFVLREFVKAGADPAILWSHKPHIGTDVLSRVVRHIREEIISLGGEVRFATCLTGIRADRNSGSYLLELNDGKDALAADQVVLAIGHSARDTFRMLENSSFQMEAKAFAVGLRVEHSQSLINRAMYGAEHIPELGAASYKLTHKCADGRGVYSFCMCPGGYVVNASSEFGRTAVNGMSCSKRDGKNANSAIVVTITPDDCRNFYQFHSGEQIWMNSPLIGIFFQRMLERNAWECADGRIPVQRFEDFCLNSPSAALGTLKPQNRGLWRLANVRDILPEELNFCIIDGIHAFGRKIPGFDAQDVLLSGVESRTSSPVRILRGENRQSISHPGVYPCGEGAGYAGGITSAAIDGIRVAEAILQKF